MSKKALLMLPVSLIVISTASCSWLFKSDRDYTAEQNPSKFLNKTNIGGNYIEYNTYTFNGDFVNRVMFKVDDAKYSYMKGTPELSDTTFTLHIRYTVLLGYGFHEIAFYENGYATTSRYDRNQGKYLTYYYQFDEDIAKSVCKMIDDEYQSVKEEERRVQEDMAITKRDYDKMIELMDIHTIIDKIKEEEITDMEFTFTTDESPKRSYTFTFRDDGSIYDLLNAATYGEYDSSNYSDEGTAGVLNIRVYTPHTWSIVVDKQAKYIDAYYSTLDKYNRSYAKHIRNSIDDDSLIAIMNRAYELSAPTNPFGNSSSNPSSSSEEHA